MANFNPGVRNIGNNEFTTSLTIAQTFLLNGISITGHSTLMHSTTIGIIVTADSNLSTAVGAASRAFATINVSLGTGRCFIAVKLIDDAGHVLGSRTRITGLTDDFGESWGEEKEEWEELHDEK